MSDEKILWCCHVRGPDDVYAAPDYETALAWSDIANAINWRAREMRGTAPPASWDECLVKAVPAIWPWSAESHAENMPESIAEFTTPAHRDDGTHSQTVVSTNLFHAYPVITHDR